MACHIFSFYAVPTLHTQKYNVPIANLTTTSPLRNEVQVTDAAGFRPENTCANNRPLLHQSSLLSTSKLLEPLPLTCTDVSFPSLRSAELKHSSDQFVLHTAFRRVHSARNKKKNAPMCPTCFAITAYSCRCFS